MRRKKGFTMIEMLIVIAVLGILAAALLATIDPFEQMKKARDTTLRNAVIDYMDALTRYYGVTGGMPWEDNGCTAPGGPDDPVKTLANLEDCTDKLIEAGELKTGYKEALGTNKNKVFISLRNAEEPTSVVLCFKPDSKSIQNDPNTVCTDKGGSGCTPPDCYWCTDVTDCGVAGGGSS